MAIIREVSDRIDKLNERQFEFVRALYIAIPPISTELPPGDMAWLATNGDRHMAGLEGDVIGEGGKTILASCARFMIPEPIGRLLDEVGERKVGGLGAPM